MNEYGIYSTARFAEPVSSWTHLLGALIFAALAIPLLRRAASRRPSPVTRRLRFVTVTIFVFSTVALLVISGVYHALPFDSSARETLLKMDYAAIFLMIAGTFTPAYGILFTGIHRWGWLTFIWVAAIAGILVKTLLPDWLPPGSDTVAYLAMGWVGIIGVITAWRWYGPSVAELLLMGGAAYTVGASFMLAARPDVISGVIGPHELFHLAVLVGLACHWAFVYRLADGQLPDLVRISDESETRFEPEQASPLRESRLESPDGKPQAAPSRGLAALPTFNSSEQAR